MANLIDYLNWRGDLTFDKVPFNDIDNLILAEISYVNLTDIVPPVKSGESVTLEEASCIFFEMNDEEELKNSKSFIWQAPFLMREAAKTERFRNLLLSNYVDNIDEIIEMQFGVFHIKLDDKNTYIAFRGTDDSLVGWKEDFNMSFISPVPSQKGAVEYMNKTADKLRGNIYVGGHSKGGNLAIYSSVYCHNKIKRKIKCIYNNDGPGFDKSVIESEEYLQMKPKIKSIVPQHSIVGMLLEHDDDYIIVESSEQGIMQHDAMSWQVMGAGFKKASKLSSASIRLNKALSRWINSIDKEQRSEFVDTLFNIITASGAKYLSEINSDIFKSAKSVFMQYTSLDRESRNMIRRLLISLTGEIGKTRHK